MQHRVDIGTSHYKLTVVLAMVLTVLAGCAGTYDRSTRDSSPSDKLYVKIEDQLPSNSGTIFPGADIEAVELVAPDGHVRQFATELIQPKPKGNGMKHHEVDPQKLYGDNPKEVPGSYPQDVIGPSLLVDVDRVFYRDKNYSWRPTYSLNGGEMIVAIPTDIVERDQAISRWNLKIYNVDGLSYDAGTPDPYRVSVRMSPNQDWRELGYASGSSMFSLGDKQPERLSEMDWQEIETILNKKPESASPMSDQIAAMIQPTLDRIETVENPRQLRSELSSFLDVYHQEKHHVQEHGYEDHGMWMANWHILKRLQTQLKKVS